MKNERGLTLIEIMATMIIIGILVSINLPTFTISNENVAKKIIYSQFESVFQKSSSDAINLGKEVKLIMGEKGYVFESEKVNKDYLYPNQVTLSSGDIGKEVKFDFNGKVTEIVQFTFYYKNKDRYDFYIDKGFQDIEINGISLNEFKK